MLRLDCAYGTSVLGLSLMTFLSMLTIEMLGHPAALTAQESVSVSVPGHAAYVVPDPWGARVREDRGVRWDSAAQSIQWTGLFRNGGQVHVEVHAVCSEDQAKHLEVMVADSGLVVNSGLVLQSQQLMEGDAALEGMRRLDFGSVDLQITDPKYVTFQLRAQSTESGDSSSISKESPVRVLQLHLDGPATKEVHFNLKERRNAASVHLNYVVDREAKIDAFYTEVQGVEDPVGTFYMACGWHRGYFGMQVNSEKERRIIFSVWDSGNEDKDRDKVADENRVRLVDKGEGVFSGDFGNEGTGGHSHLKYPWKTGSTQRFLVTAQATDTTHTTFSGYWFHPEKMEWMLISAWNAPKERGYLRGLHSFSENFLGENGHLPRKALYGNSWYRSENGTWREIRTAKFSHDQTGKADRLDRTMGIENNRFFLQHGGFLEGYTEYGVPFTREPGVEPPVDIGALLPKQSSSK